MSYGLNIGLDIIIKILNSLFWKIFAATFPSEAQAVSLNICASQNEQSMGENV